MYVGTKKVQKSVQFWTISDFDREYLCNRSRHQQSENDVVDYNPFCFWWWQWNWYSIGWKNGDILRGRYLNTRLL